MILVTASIVGTPAPGDELLAVSLEHVRRSRREPGCLSHAVHRDAEKPLRLVFLEQWADAASLEAHFAVPASRDFVRVASSLADSAPTLAVFEATQRPSST